MGIENQQQTEKWTVREEVKEVLKRRKALDQQFARIKSFYGDQIQDKIQKFQVPEKMVVSAYYLAREIMDQVGISPHQYTKDVPTFKRELLSDDERVEKIIESLIIARDYYGETHIENVATYYQLINEVTTKIFKEIIKLKRVRTPQKVIVTTIIDSYLKPSFEFFAQQLPNLDFRWLLAEIEAFLRNDFPKKYFLEIKNEFSSPEFQEELYFEAGVWILERYMKWSVVETKEDEEHIKQLQDIGRTSFEYALTTFYNIQNQQLLNLPAPTIMEDPCEDLITTTKNLLLINQDIMNKSPYKLKYSKTRFTLQRGKNQQHETRTGYLLNEEINDKGAWQRAVLSVEDINISLLSTFLEERCHNIEGSIKRTEKDVDKQDQPIFIPTTQYWDETIMHYCQEGQDYVIISNHYTEMRYIPISIVKITPEKSEALIRMRKAQHAGNIMGQETYITRETQEELIRIINIITGVFYEESKVIYQRKENLELTMMLGFANEILFVNKNDPEDIILGQVVFDKDERTILIIFSKNHKENQPIKSLMKRSIQSKLNQILSISKIKSLEDALDMKMDNTTLHHENTIYSVLPSYYPVYEETDASAEQIASKKSSKVQEKFDTAVSEQMNQLKQLRRNYLNEVVMPSLLDLIALDIRKYVLEQLEEKNQAINPEKVGNILKSIERREKQLISTQNNEIPEFLHEDIEKFRKVAISEYHNLSKHLDKIINILDEKIGTMSKEDITNALLD